MPTDKWHTKVSYSLHKASDEGCLAHRILNNVKKGMLS